MRFCWPLNIEVVQGRCVLEAERQGALSMHWTPAERYTLIERSRKENFQMLSFSSRNNKMNKIEGEGESVEMGPATGRFQAAVVMWWRSGPRCRLESRVWSACSPAKCPTPSLLGYEFGQLLSGWLEFRQNRRHAVAHCVIISLFTRMDVAGFVF